MSEGRRRSSQYSTTPIVARRRSSTARYGKEPVDLYPSRRASQIALRQKQIQRRENFKRFLNALSALAVAAVFWWFFLPPLWLPKNPRLQTHSYSSDSPSLKDSPFEIDYLRRRLPTMVNQVANMSLSVSKIAPGGMLLSIIGDQADEARMLAKKNLFNTNIFGEANKDDAERIFRQLTDQYRAAFVHARAANDDLEKFSTISKALAEGTSKGLTNITKELTITCKLLDSPDIYAALQNFSSRAIESLRGIQSDRNTLTEKIKRIISFGYLADLDKDLAKIASSKAELRYYGNDAKTYLLNKKRIYEEYKASCDLAGIFCRKNPSPRLEPAETWLLCVLSGEECELMDGTSSDLTKQRKSLDGLLNTAAEQLVDMNGKLKDDLFYVEAGKEAQRGWPTWYSGLSTAPLVIEALKDVKEVAGRFERDLRTAVGRVREGEKRRSVVEVKCWRNRAACLYERPRNGALIYQPKIDIMLQRCILSTHSCTLLQRSALTG
ncbi:hypothetical protein HYFRA_00010498 [Hymenoscyphus fraxineus]|uniref:Uncharacterized protein n=1 Tax=Hymenoscyphus fraxineus TaxID=746836 RepID=A0A9N9L2Z6_9HELO|nr:hypothetical protein HYFRA_00010498 [Hymenoscyphus fraxineus]